MRFAYPYGNVYFGYLNVIINPVILPVSKLSYLVFHSNSHQEKQCLTKVVISFLGHPLFYGRRKLCESLKKRHNRI